MKQDPVLMSDDLIKEEDDSHNDFLLDDSLQLFDTFSWRRYTYIGNVR